VNCYSESFQGGFYEKLAGCIVHESPRGNKSAVSVVTLNNVHDAAYLICTLHNLTTNDDIYREPTAKRLKLTPEEQKLGDILFVAEYWAN